MPSGKIPGTVFENPILSPTFDTPTFTGFQIEQAADLTAFATGGQASATPIATPVARVTVCATAGDSVKLPATTGKVSTQVFVANGGAQSCNVFPATGEQINALGANAAFAVAAGKTATFIVTAAGQWHAILSA